MGSELLDAQLKRPLLRAQTILVRGDLGDLLRQRVGLRGRDSLALQGDPGQVLATRSDRPARLVVELRNAVQQPLRLLLELLL